MSVLLYFLWEDWPAAPEAEYVEEEDYSGAGSGGKKGKNRSKKSTAYTPVSGEFWDAREAYLRTLYPEELPPTPAPDNSVLEYEREANRAVEERKQQIEQLNADRAAAISALRHSSDAQSMKQQGAKIAEINTKIHNLMGKQAYARFMQ